MAGDFSKCQALEFGVFIALILIKSKNRVIIHANQLCL
nr:MAG TPA: hypothetical protein [Bacteriophage sp.]